MLQLTFTEGVSLKVQYPPTRGLQSQSLVTNKMFDTLEVSQVFMWTMGQHPNFLVADATIRVARCASCICSSSDEETTDFICLPHFLHFKRALWPHTSTGVTRFWLFCTRITCVSNMWTRGAVLCPRCLRTASNSVHKEVQWSEEDYESHGVRITILTPHERIQKLCSFFSTNWEAQRHQLMSGGTIWSNCRINGKMV